MNSGTVPRYLLRTGFMALCLFGCWADALASTPGVADVQEFGAKGDGRTDDTAAIRKAVGSLGEQGGVVYFPPGQYLSEVIVGKSRITFRGDSGVVYRGDIPGASVLMPARDSQPCLFDLKGCVGTRLVGLSLNGKNLGKEIHGVYSQHTGVEQNIVIDDCKIENFTGSGVRLDKVWVFAIRHSLIAHNKLSGIDGSGSYDGWILDNQLTGNGRGGLFATNFATVTITANRIEWNRLGGIVLGPVSANTLQICGCTFDRNRGPGIDINLTGRSGGSSANVINGNIFRRNGYMRDSEPEASVHLSLRNVKGTVVTGNSMFGGPHGKDATLDRPPSPLNGMLLEGLVDSVVANNSLFWAGRDVLIIDKGGHKNSVIKDNPGSLVEVKAKPETRKLPRNLTFSHHKQTYASASRS